MIIAIIILAYVANVFLNRWLNKIDYKKYNASVEPVIWYLSIFGTLILLLSLFGELHKDSWFTGKNW